MLIIVDTKDLNTVLNAYIPLLLVHIFKITFYKPVVRGASLLPCTDKFHTQR